MHYKTSSIMKKFLITIAITVVSTASWAQKIVGDTAYGIAPIPYDESSLTSEILQQEQMLRTLYLCGFLLALGACLTIYFIYNRKIKKYGEVVNLQSQALMKQKQQTDSFGLMLNLAQFPCCLVSADSKIIWSNEAFTTFYGKDRQSISPEEGAPEVQGQLTLNKLGTTFMVKMKNTYGKTFGFKRTVIPIKDGTNGFAIIENITD